MGARQLVGVSGHCPIQDDEYEIDVVYREIPVLGKAESEYRKMSFYCDYSDEHNCQISNECPIYLAASQLRKF